MRLRFVGYLWVLFLAWGTFPTYAQEGKQRGKMDVSAGVGIAIVGDGIGGTFYLTGALRYFVTENIAVEGEVGYWRKSYTIELFDPFEGTIRGEIPARDLTIGVNFLYTLPTRRTGFDVFAGVGVGINFQKISASVRGVGFAAEIVSVSETDASLRLLGGIQVPMGQNMTVFGIIRYDVSGPSVFKLYGGFRYIL